MTSEDNLVISVDSETELRLVKDSSAADIYETIRENWSYLAEWVYWVNEEYTEKRNVHAIELFVAVDNVASNRVAEKLGFEKREQVHSQKLENHYVRKYR